MVATRNECGESSAGSPMPFMRRLIIRPMSSVVIAVALSALVPRESRRNRGSATGTDRNPAPSRYHLTTTLHRTGSCSNSSLIL